MSDFKFSISFIVFLKWLSLSKAVIKIVKHQNSKNRIILILDPRGMGFGEYLPFAISMFSNANLINNLYLLPSKLLIKEGLLLKIKVQRSKVNNESFDTNCVTIKINLSEKKKHLTLLANTMSRKEV